MIDRDDLEIEYSELLFKEPLAAPVEVLRLEQLRLELGISVTTHFEICRAFDDHKFACVRAGIDKESLYVKD